jgi:hypothetical protein
MRFMVKDKHIDGELFRLFVQSGIYKQYADQHLKPEQIDDVDVGMLLEGLVEAPASGDQTVAVPRPHATVIAAVEAATAAAAASAEDQTSPGLLRADALEMQQMGNTLGHRSDGTQPMIDEVDAPV